MKHYVYKIFDPITNEFYYGSRTHKTPSDDDYMGSYATWKPKDESRLIKEILKADFESRSDAIEYEAKLIKRDIDNVLNRNYHIPNKGFHTTGISKTISEETRLKMSESTKKYFETHDPPMKGKKHTEEAKMKISNAGKGNAYALGNTHSEEFKERMRNLHSGIPKSEEHKQKISNALKGKAKTKEHVENMKRALPSRTGNSNPNFGKGQQCIINGVEYATISEASRDLEINASTISYRLNKSTYPSWIKINDNN